MLRVSEGRPEPATIEEVARAAKVSTATVSRVLNGSAPVAAATRERIQQAIDTLGYIPNDQARQLRRGRSGTIGFLVPDIADPSYAGVFQALSRAVRARGCTVVGFDSSGSPELEAEALDVLLRSRISGLAVASPGGLSPESLTLLRSRHVPVVFFDDRPDDVSVSSVTLDDRRGARLLTSHLLSLGHRRIGLVSGRLDGSSGIDRRDGYLDALHEHGVGSDPELIRGNGWGLEVGRAATEELLRLENRPTAIVTVDPLAVVGALAAIRAAGLAVPSEISLVNFSDAPHLRYLDPPITCLLGAEKATGKAIANLLFDETNLPRAVRVSLDFEERHSTAAARGS